MWVDMWFYALWMARLDGKRTASLMGFVISDHLAGIFTVNFNYFGQINGIKLNYPKYRQLVIL